VLQFTTVSGGISNVNAKLSPKAELGLQPVLFKVFGDETEQIIDREAEKVVVVALGQQGFGPKVRTTAAAVFLSATASSSAGQHTSLPVLQCTHGLRKLSKQQSQVLLNG
jgi:hypothetical protein